MLLTSITFSAPAQPNHSNEWSYAARAISNHLQRLDPQMPYAEFDTDLLRKYLPKVRLYVRYDDLHLGQDRVFLVTQDGQTTNLPESWKGNEDEGCWRARELTTYLRGHQIEVKDANAAIEVAQLVEEIQHAPRYLCNLWRNTRHLRVFRKQSNEQQFPRGTSYSYIASSRTNGWTVKVGYVGPPASIIAPPTYEFDLDTNRRFQDVRRYTLGFDGRKKLTSRR